MINLQELYKRYQAEEKKWIEAGRPMRSPERMKEIYNLCASCPLFKVGQGWLPGYDKCGICQCNLHPKNKRMNKIAWATTSCPKEDPEWVADDLDKDEFPSTPET